MLPRVLSTIALSLLVLAAAAPAALPQSDPFLSVVQNNEGSVVLHLTIPIVDGGLPGDGSYSWPTAGGILHVNLQPVTLPGEGGSVDVDAYLAEATFIADGVITPLPSLLVVPDQETVTGPASEALEMLSAKAAELEIELRELQLELQEEQSGAEDDLDAAFLAVEDDVNAALAGVAWVTAIAEGAAGASSEGLGPTIALVNALLAHVERYIPIIEEFLAGAQALVDSIQPPPFLLEKVEETKADLSGRLSEAQSDLDDLKGFAEEARDGLILYAQQEAAERGEQVDDNVTMVQESARPYVEAALLQLEAALEALEEEEDEGGGDPDPEPEEPSPEEKMLQENLTRAENEAAGAIAKLEELRADLANSGEENVSALQAEIDIVLRSIDDALAPMGFALAAIEKARETTEEGAQIPLQYAEEQTQAAITAVEEVRLIVLDGIDQQYGPTIDAGLAEAETKLNEAASQAAAAQASLDEARSELESDLAGVLEPPEEDPSEEPPAEEPEESDDIAICLDQPTSIVCAEYAKPGQPGSELTLIITIPNVLGFLSGLPLPNDVVFPTVPSAMMPSATMPVGPSVSPGAPGVPIGPPGAPIGPPSVPSVTAPGVPQPSLTQTVPPATQLPPLPGMTDPTLPSDSSGASESSMASSSGTSQSGTTQAQPKVGISAAPPSSSLREGQQDLLRVAVKNDGNAADDVYLGAQTDAPITIDSTQEMLHLEPGASGEFVLRLTPLAPGAGTINLIASSGNGATATHDVAVTVADVASSQSNIGFAVDPMLLDTEVGKLSILTLRVENKGGVAEEITILASSTAAQVEPAMLEVVLQPGASTIREVSVTPTLSGKSSVQVHMQSERGANLKPIVVMDAEPKSQNVDEDPVPVPSKGKSPGLAVPMIVAVLALALVFVRRRIK